MTGRLPKGLVLSSRHKLCDRNSFFAIANARLTAAGSAFYGSFPLYSTDEYENAKNPGDEPPGDMNEWRIPVLDCHSQDCVQREPQRWGSDQTRAWVVRGGMPGHRGRPWGGAAGPFPAHTTDVATRGWCRPPARATLPWQQLSVLELRALLRDGAALAGG